MSYDLKILNNDISLNRDGTVQVSIDNEKLAQDIIKAVLTPLGSNKFYRWYGSTVGDRTIGHAQDDTLTKIEAERAIQDTLSNVIALQKAQGQGQYVSPGETISAIKGIFVTRSEEDPRQYEITISVLTKQLSIVEETFRLRV